MNAIKDLVESMVRLGEKVVGDLGGPRGLALGREEWAAVAMYAAKQAKAGDKTLELLVSATWLR